MTRFTGLAAILISVPALLSAQDSFGIPTGPYVGLTLGSTQYEGDVDVDGGEFGLVAGFAGTRNRLYGGLEIEYAFSDVSGEDESGGVEVELKEEDKFIVSAMLGGVVAPNFVLYGKVSSMAIDYELEGRGFGQSVSFEDGSRGTGLGIGAQYFATPQVSVRGEVMNFEVDLEFDDLDLESDADGTMAKLGVMYHF